ncbi:helix-turn-helix domain-containing protein [Aestuariicella hydrocarbonica]|uniref:Helix-turn-helix domain-containing protein n=1 Tax=Pseudomaricurvus hydrocarbonicus TaxID=1470433 RepID=A0A9E5MPY1_9GAMM|nr:helix-turn-helix transcriptional regulator [Aestuariicella hydrocarbonica]NHO68261.1 helix-turn-helix domain-containing protein [Aestuariicella hydrocarbonica]
MLMENPKKLSTNFSDFMLGVDTVLRAMSKSSTIENHRTFYEWLRNDISPFLPHQTMLAVWGDFRTNSLNYDLTSSIGGIKTHMLYEVSGFDSIMVRLLKAAARSQKKWILIKDFKSLSEKSGLNFDSSVYGVMMENTKAMLIYAMRDARSGHDCLYVFFTMNDKFYYNPVILDLIMPHIDSALRTIKLLDKKEIIERSTPIQPRFLSDREREILDWVSQGKSNDEIGMILGISHNTVKNHLKRIFGKMGVTSRSQAVSVYIQTVNAYSLS